MLLSFSKDRDGIGVSRRVVMGFKEKTAYASTFHAAGPETEQFRVDPPIAQHVIERIVH
jgi:hypothetical protein